MAFSERLEIFLSSKPRRWERRLVQRPWLLPIIALHLAARRLQRAWRQSWLRFARPHASVYDAEGIPAPPSVEELLQPTVEVPERRIRSPGHAAAVLRRRHLEHLRQLVVLPTSTTAGPARVYETFKSFCLAVLQGWWRSRIHLWRARRVRDYMPLKLYQVAAFEIQQAYQSYARRVQWRIRQDESQRSAEQEGLVQYAKKLAEAARRIQHAWRGRRDMRTFSTLRETIAAFRRSGDPYLLLRGVLGRECVLLDPAMQVHVRFRLGGPRFPPTIYYKIYTHGNVVDLGSFAPRDYHLERLNQENGIAVPGDYNWYQRIENNGWRPLAVRLKNTVEGLADEEMEKVTARKPTTNFHFSKLRRRADMERLRKLRKIEWFQKLYGVSQMSRELNNEASPISPAVAPPSEWSPDDASEGGTPRRQIVETQQNEDDDVLLDWTRKLDFDAYMEVWQSLATSDGSEGALPITTAKTAPGAGLF